MTSTQGTKKQRRLLTREQCLQEIGLDFPQEVLWRQWEPGHSYTRKIVIRNLTTKLAKYKPQLPENKCFLMDYPQLTIIPPGVTQIVQVTFLPIKKQDILDHVTFVLADAVIKIPLRALTPRLNVSSPDPIAFGKCAVASKTTKNFQLVNTGEIKLEYTWKFVTPFTITPEKGEITPGQSLTFTATFSPTEATAFTSVAVCTLNNGADYRTLSLDGSGKFPFVEISAPAVDFGESLVGRSVTREIILTNPSLVPCAVTVDKVEGGGTTPENQFLCSPNQMVLNPGESGPVKITFTPVVSGMHLAESFIVKAAGNSRTFRCSGTSTGPAASLNTNSVCFGAIALGTTTSRIVTLSNPTEEPVPFQFTTNNPNKGTFRFEPAQGIVPKNGSINVAVRFHPTQPIAFHKRVFCLFRGSPPLWVDVLGSAFNDTTRPPTLCQRHVDSHFQRMAADPELGLLPPERLEQVLAQREREETSGKRKVTRFSEALDAKEAATPRSAVVSPAAGASSTSLTQGQSPAAKAQAQAAQLYETYLDNYLSQVAAQDPSATSSTSGVFSVEEVVNFGKCNKNEPIEPKILRIRNFSKGRVSIMWIPAEAQAGAPPPVFTVSPALVELDPGQSYLFKVFFRPSHDNSCFGEVLEFYGFHKAMRNFRLVTEKTTLPPWSISVTAYGNTFTNMAEQINSKITLSNKKVFFSPCPFKGIDHQSVKVTCSGDSPVMVDVNVSPPEMRSAFTPLPQHFFLLPGQFQVLTFEFSPPNLGRYQAAVQLTVNGVEDDSANRLLLFGVSAAPKLAFDISEKALFFHPTSLQTTTERSFTARNTSGVPLIFKWDLGEGHKTFNIHPVSGVILSNCEETFRCSFTPRRAREYSTKAVITFSCSEGSAEQQQQKTELNLVGLGAEGTLTVTPSGVDFGNVLVGGTCKKTVYLYNPTQCYVQYRVLIAQTKGIKIARERELSPDSDDDKEEIDPRSYTQAIPVLVEPSRGTLAARSRIPITFTLRPNTRKKYSLIAKIVTGDTARPGSRAGSAMEGYHGGRSSPPPQHTTAYFGPDFAHLPGCTLSLSAVGALPTLAVTNAHRDGFGKIRLWEALELAQLNQELSSDVTADERHFTQQNGLSGDCAEACLSAFSFNFGTGEEGSSPSIAQLQFTNSGPVPLKWKMQFQNNPQVPQEPWMSSEDRSEYEKKQAAALENRVFELFPMSGSLNPGASQVVRLTYNHRSVDKDEVPVILNVKNGKSVLLNLCGVTVAQGSQVLTHPRLMRPSSNALTYPLSPGVVGGQVHQPPVHFYTLRNPSATAAVEYEFDLSPLEQLKELNHGFDVLTCENPKGSIPPSGSAFVRWIFNPLEVKQYSCSLTASASGTKSAMVTFTSHGCHPREEPEATKDDWEPVGLSGDVIFPGQLGGVYPYTLKLGRVPLYSAVRRILTIRNPQEFPISFKWEMGQIPPLQEVGIEPKQGVLQPGATTVCKMLFSGKERTGVFDFEIGCTFEAIRSAEEQVEEVKQRQQSIPAASGPRPQSEEMILEHKSGVSAPSQPKKKDKAPAGEDDEMPVPEKEEELAPPPPIPLPKKSTVLINIVARTYQPDSFKILGGDLGKFYIQPNMPAPSVPEKVLERPAEAREVSEDIMVMMVKEILQDQDVVSICSADVLNQPVPYFEHLRARLAKTTAGDSKYNVEEEEVRPQTVKQPEYSGPDKKLPATRPLTQPQKLAGAERRMKGVSFADGETVGPEGGSGQEKPGLGNLADNTEFQQMAEAVLEGTLTNLMREAFAGVWDMTKPMPVVANPTNFKNQ